MTTSYAPLIRIRVRHPYYAAGIATDCDIEPTPATRALIQERALLFRTQPGGCMVAAEMVPGSAPPELVRPMDGESLRMAFTLAPRGPFLEQITALPPRRPFRTVFHYSNMTADAEDGVLYLDDPVAETRLGGPVELVTSDRYRHVPGGLDPGLTVSLTSIFGRTSEPVPYAVSGSREVIVKLAGIAPGRYKLTDSAGGSAHFCYAPDLAGAGPLGLIELYGDTRRLTPGGNDLVPAAYRFASGAAPVEYNIQFESMATVWRYRVTKRYQTNQVELKNISIAGSVPFTSLIEGECAVFTSTAPVVFQELPRRLTLLDGQTGIRRLLNPKPGIALKKDAATGTLVSEVNVYL